MPGIALPTSMEPTLDDLTNERLYTPAQVGRLWSMHESTIYRMLAAGELRYIIVRGKRRVTATEIRRFIAARSQPPAPVRRGLRQL